MLKHNYRDKPAAFWSHDPIWSERSETGNVTGWVLVGQKELVPPPPAPPTGTSETQQRKA